MKNQNGFALVEGLLIVIILSVIGFAGYTVWSNNQDEESKNTVAIQQKNDEVETGSSDKKSEEKSAPDGWVLYNSNQGLSLYHPSEWTVSESENTCCEQLVNDNLATSDFEEVEKAFGKEVSEGAKVTVTVDETSVASLSEIDRSGGPLGEWWTASPQTVTEIGGVEAWQYEFTYEGDSPFYTEIINEGKRFTISFDGTGFEDETESDVFVTYSQILDTIGFN